MPVAVHVAPTGDFYVAEYQSSLIKKVDTNGIITIVAGGGTDGPGSRATSAHVSSPAWVTQDALGNLLIAAGDNRIWKVNYAGLPTLTLSKVTITNAGSYQVVVTGPGGSVTSSVANLALVLPPIAPAFTTSNGVYTLQWSAVSNLTYQLQYATNLLAPVWIDLGSPITATNNSVSAADMLGTDGQRFYRVRLWP
jgi:hypothetical protein